MRLRNDPGMLLRMTDRAENTGNCGISFVHIRAS